MGNPVEMYLSLFFPGMALMVIGVDENDDHNYTVSIETLGDSGPFPSCLRSLNPITNPLWSLFNGARDYELHGSVLGKFSFSNAKHSP